MTIASENMYEHQVVSCVQELLSCTEQSIDDIGIDGLVDFIEDHQSLFGEIIIENMIAQAEKEI